MREDLNSKMSFKGRASGVNPASRFDSTEVLIDEAVLAERKTLKTEFLSDATASIISTNKSPDIPLNVSLNPYRGCEHGCAYCYARPTHEYLGFSAGLDFESKIVVKHNAPSLLKEALSQSKWNPEPIFMSGVTDPYQPIERKLEITRKCLKVLAEHRHPVALISKNNIILRDLDVLKQLAHWNCVSVTISVTSLDVEIARRMEPRTASPRQRLETVARLSSEGIPVGVMAAPMIPGLTDLELPAIIAQAAEAGAQWVKYIPIRLPFGVRDIFTDWLERNFPSRKDRVLSRIKSLRGGQLNDARFGSRMQGEGIWAKELQHLYRLGMLKSKMKTTFPELSTHHFRPPQGKQLMLF